jgi:hypothetical protein
LTPKATPGWPEWVVNQSLFPTFYRQKTAKKEIFKDSNKSRPTSVFLCVLCGKRFSANHPMTAITRDHPMGTPPPVLTQFDPRAPKATQESAEGCNLGHWGATAILRVFPVAGAILTAKI